MIKYKDFAPRIVKRGLLREPIEVESFSDAVNVANQWIENRAIQVINIETVILPDNSEGTSMGIYGGSMLGYSYLQCVRVWYRE